MPQERTNFAAYAIRNRVLRYGKQCRQLLGSNDRTSNRSNLFRLICLLIACSILWFVVTFLFGNASEKLKIQESQTVTRTTNGINESQINEPAFDLLSLGQIESDADRAKRDEGMRVHAFNTLLSERIGRRRPLPDTRHQLCRNQSQDQTRGSGHWDTSVIICFFNEDWATLQRTIYTVLERTPEALIKEIILVDDHSDSRNRQFFPLNPSNIFFYHFR